ncbi:MAG: hypothetical protein JJE09_02385 [Bacteroidia bacterium]|nr:hypothetical protein [Bacteroidia bacterium]
MQTSLHSFHIPVMGLAFTVDSPIKVARFGIPSVMSIVEDRLIEMMRKHYYGSINEKYTPITTHEPDYRAKRITDYLNLVFKIVNEQIEILKASAFKAGNDLAKYFEMLPTNNKLRELYFQMIQSPDGSKKASLQDYLKSQIVSGSIDVNIMTKLDGNNSGNKGVVIEDGTDAVSALRGYALSALNNSSIIFSAGLNPRLFNYLEKFTTFDATGLGEFSKKVVIKVSDYRSALIQGKYLAKKGIWVSEFRLESGLNCGGHAFATDGYLMGPILEEFKNKREELITTLHAIYSPAIKAKGKLAFDSPHPIKITAQGGIGTASENEFILRHYGVDSTGWGTPFLLCPEATTVDENTLGLLSKATKSNINLSNNSPLGVRFHYLKGTTSENEKLTRIESGKPGSPCTEKHLAFNTEFTTEPICTASHKYQRLKIEQLKSLNLSEDEFQKQLDNVYAKECLCVGLSNSASLEYKQPFLKRLKSVTICPGPNIAFFSEIVSLQQMTDHIYGRADILQREDRPHMFINELQLYIDYLKEQIELAGEEEKRIQYCIKFGENMLAGINYYKSLDTVLDTISSKMALEQAENQINTMLDCFLIKQKE